MTPIIDLLAKIFDKRIYNSCNHPSDKLNFFGSNLSLDTRVKCIKCQKFLRPCYTEIGTYFLTEQEEQELFR